MLNIIKILKLFSNRNFFWVLFFSLISNIFQTLLLLCIPLLSFFYLEKSFNSEENFLINKINKITNIDLNFLFISYATLTIIIISTLSNLAYLFTSSNLSFNTGKKIQLLAFRYFLFQPYSFFQKMNKNEIINKSIQDIIRIPNGIFIPFFNIFNSLSLILIIFIALIILNPLIAILLIIFFCFLYFFLFLKIKFKLKKFSQDLTDIHKNFIEISNFIFGLNKDIRHYNKEDYFLNKVEESSKKYEKIRIFLNVISISPRYIIEGIVVFLLISFIIYSVQSNIFSQEIIFEVLIILLFTLRIIPNLQLIFSQFSTVQSNLTVLEGISKYNIKCNFIINKKVQFKNKIELKNIYFSYDDKIIFKDLNLKINKGDKIGIIGPNGSGKTTLINLLSGFTKIQKGEIYIDERKNLKKIYSYCGTVTSEPIILNGSLYQNICLQDSINNEIKEKINKIITQLNINKIRDSYVLERDVSQKLSQGEKQLIALARFVFFDKKILIIDEGTSNLRVEVEKSFIKSLDKINKNITIIFITHRFTNLDMFSKIYEIQNKKLKPYLITNRKS
jgi:ABC-type multidrug transport system fused ATPase/permease subunit